MADTMAGKLLEVVQAVRPRRVSGMDDMMGWYYYNWSGCQRELLLWIHNNTTGKFHFDWVQVAFQDEKDAMMFKLGWKDG